VSAPAAEGPDAGRRERVRAALREVIDPEVGLDVVTMGLVYGIEVEGPSVRVRHTLTTPGCPMGDVLGKGIAEAARSVSGVEEVETELVWEPRWDPGMIDDDAWNGREET
jgi:metal-sulfur cluster biosynthetic enzyme